MNRKLVVLLVAAVIAGRGTLLAQKPGTPLRPEAFFSKAVVSLRDGRVLYGFVSDLEPRALIIRRGGEDIRLSPEEIAKVVLVGERHRSRFMMYGAIAGVYGWNILAGSGRNQPTAFSQPRGASAWGTLWANSIYAVAGMGLGYLASLFERSERTFTFDSGPDRLAEDWRKLSAFLSGAASRSRRVHFYVQSAQVLPGASGRYGRAFRDAGYEETSWHLFTSTQDGGYAEQVGLFNFLRGLRLTLSLGRRLEAGAAVLFLGEPAVGGFDYSSSWNEWRETGARFDATGYFAVASFDVLAGASQKSIRWKIGGGAGMARVKFTLDMTRTAYASSGYSDSAESYSVSKSQFCPLVFTEIQFPLMTGLSFGLHADFVPASSQSVPAFPEWGLPARKISLGNGSVGASLGLHF